MACFNVSSSSDPSKCRCTARAAWALAMRPITLVVPRRSPSCFAATSARRYKGSANSSDPSSWQMWASATYARYKTRRSSVCASFNASSACVMASGTRGPWIRCSAAVAAHSAASEDRPSDSASASFCSNRSLDGSASPRKKSRMARAMQSRTVSGPLSPRHSSTACARSSASLASVRRLARAQRVASSIKCRASASLMQSAVPGGFGRSRRLGAQYVAGRERMGQRAGAEVR